VERDSRIYVAGHRGLVGSAVLRALLTAGCTNLLTRTHAELDLTDQAAVRAFFETERPRVVFMAAAKVGGIHWNNTYRAEFIYNNLAIELNVIHAAWQAGVERMIFLGSSCIYPRECPQPMREEYLLTGPLEETNEPYAIAKIAGVKLCEAYNAQYGTRYLSVMPTNLFGINDNFDLEAAHVLPALIRRMHEAKLADAPSVTVWGSGTPRREFLFVDDLAEALLFLADRTVDVPMLNIGSGHEVTIRELAELVRDVVGFRGRVQFDPSRPDGTPRKLLDSGRMHALGWHARTGLREGIEVTYQWFVENYGRS